MSRHRRSPEKPGRHRASTDTAGRHRPATIPAQGRGGAPARRRSGPTGALATIPMIGLLVALSLMPGTTPTGRSPSPTARLNAPAVVVHPPTRGYDDRLPDLIPTLRAASDTDAPTTPPTPTPTVPPTASAAVPDDRTLAAAATHRSPTAAAVVLTATERRIPTRMLTAYRAAAVRTAAEHPACHLPWQLLAGIGRIESGHAAGHTLTADGTLTRPILGPPLDGHDGRALLRDTDHGTLDHDTRYDRAVGPMQFIPTTWASAGRDNSGDGRADPDNVDDATLAAAGYLCRHGRDLADPAQLRAAIFSYNPSTSYVRAVLAWTAGYTTGYAATDATPRTAATPGAPVPPLPAYPPPPTSPPLSPSPAPTPTPTPTPTPAPLRSAPTGSASAPRPAADPVAGRPATGPPPPAATAATSTAPGESLGDPSDPPTVPPGGSLRVIPLTTPATPPAAAQSAPPP